MSQGVLRKFRKDVVALNSQDVSVQDKVEILHNFCHLAGFGDNMGEFVAAQGLRMLAHISTAEWPEDGDLRNSKSSFDKDAELQEERVFRQTMLHVSAASTPQQPTYQSMRRVAIGCLGEMCNYAEYVQALMTDNFYFHLPKMLRDTGKQYKYGQTYDELYGIKSGTKTDHAQFIFERLVNIMAGSIGNLRSNRAVFDFLCEKCIPEAGSHIDIFQYERRSNMPVNVRGDPLIECFTRCVFNMLEVSKQFPLTRAAQVAIFNAGLWARIINMPPLAQQYQRSIVLMTLQQQQERLMELLHLPALYVEMQRMRQASTAICEAAAARFAAGEFKGALDQYRGALQACPWSYEGAAGVAAALLASRKPKKALDAAFLAVQLFPRWADGWVRLAEVMLAFGDPQKARRCIELSRKLAPRSPDSFDMEALSAATPAPSDAHTNTEPVNMSLNGLSMLALAMERAAATSMVMQEWTLSAATFGQTGPVYKAPVYIMSLMAGTGLMVDQEVCEGLPSPELIQAVLLRGMAYQRSCRPSKVLIAFRLAYAWPLMKALQRTLGGQVAFTLEPKYDAMLSATRNGTDYLGFNGEESGRKEYTRLMLADI